jgi:hypothetical protein
MGAVAALAVATLLALAACSPSAPLRRPLATPLASVQSGTLRIQLHQVMVLTLSEIVPLKAGVTQVALTSSRPGHEVVGFRVIVVAPPVVRALAESY